jgi:hypothetical protein
LSVIIHACAGASSRQRACGYTIYDLSNLPWIATFNRLIPMVNSESSDSPQVKFFLEWGQIFQTADLDLIAKCLHKDFRCALYPKSLGKPEETREEWLERLVGVLSLWTAGHEVGYVAPQTPFAVTKSLLQSTYHSMIDTPGKLIAHVCISHTWLHPIYLYNVVPAYPVRFQQKINSI